MLVKASRLSHLAITLLTFLAVSASASTPKEQVIYSFQGGNDGAFPSSDLVADSAGNLYGTSVYGGTGLCTDSDGFVIGCGTVFELIKPGKVGGKWTESVLYSFQGVQQTSFDSAFPLAGLTFDSRGNLYGTTSGGSTSYDLGYVFELSPPATKGGAWTRTTLYSFQGGTDGASPRGGVVFDKQGRLYGSTNTGAPLAGGTVFRLTPPAKAGSAWTETVLYDFTGGTDGQNPAGVVLDSKGNIYGTTSGGGGFGIGDQYTNSWAGGGTAFELTPGGLGKPWNENLTFLFPTCYSNPSEGEYCGSSTQPESKLIWDSSGNLYGTTQIGGQINNCNDDKGIYLIGCGAVFQFVPPSTAGGAWTQNVLYQFGGGSYIDGQFPLADLAFDTKGNLYGTTSAGGSSALGMLFELTPPSTKGASWTETILYNFVGGSDGATPSAGLIAGTGGAFYSTTQYGGSGNCMHMIVEPTGCGTVFAIQP
jgi:uncharacterized repeat protein (TIGR03803 family)